MKGKLFVIASGTLESGGGIVISYHFPNLEPLGWVLIGIGIISLILGLTWKYVVKCSKWLQSTIKVVFQVITRIEEANSYLVLKDDQKKNPEKWLYLVIEYIDLNRQGSAHDDNDVYVGFQIDSHLLFPVSDFYVFQKLCLKVPKTIYSSESEWYEIEQPQHYAPIMQLERHRFSEQTIHLLGKTDGEKALLDWMKDFRDPTKNKPLLAMLEIGVKFKKDDKPIPIDLNVLEGKVSRYIAPMNDYRGG